MPVLCNGGQRQQKLEHSTRTGNDFGGGQKQNRFLHSFIFDEWNCDDDEHCYVNHPPHHITVADPVQIININKRNASNEVK